MSTIRVIVAGAIVAASAFAAAMIPGDARRGQQLFQSEQCVQCHSFKGQGGRIAPDLGSGVDRNYTPAVMASIMWNHAPDMWAAMKKQGIVKATLSPEAAADLFAYFISARFFERPGDAARGKVLFASRHCAECHGITTSNAAGAPPVAKWESLADPVILAEQMWNHSSGMRQAFAAKKLAWSQLTGQELTDILVYLQHLPETKQLASNFSFPPSSGGEELFQSKGCAGCHNGPRMALENRLKNQTMTDIAVDMWNHAPSMKQPAPALSQEEMRQLIGYLWARQYLAQGGSSERGKKVFAEKNCASCHGDKSSGAPSLAAGKGSYSDITMMSVLWQHGPRMLERMNERRLAWPRFTATQMTDLIAYLNTQQ